MVKHTWIELTTVCRLRGPRVALRVRVKWFLHLLLLPLFPAAALGPFGHLAEGAEAEAISSAAVTNPSIRSRRVTVAWPWMLLPGCDAATASQRTDLLYDRLLREQFQEPSWCLLLQTNGCTRWRLHDQLQKWLSLNRGSCSIQRSDAFDNWGL